MCSALIFDCFRWMFMFFGIQHVPRSCEELNDAEDCLAKGVRVSILEKMGASRKKKQDLPKQELRFVTAFTGEASCSSMVAMEHSCSRAVPPLVVRTGSSLCKLQLRSVIIRHGLFTEQCHFTGCRRWHDLLQHWGAPLLLSYVCGQGVGLSRDGGCS